MDFSLAHPSNFVEIPRITQIKNIPVWKISKMWLQITKDPSKHMAIILFYLRYVSFSCPHTHTPTQALTTVWSNFNLHPEKPLPWWQTNLKPHPEGLSFSCFISFPASLVPHTSTSTRQPLFWYPSFPNPCCDWLFAAVNHTGEDDFGLRLWPLWLQVQRLSSGWSLVLGFGVYLVSTYLTTNRVCLQPTHDTRWVLQKTHIIHVASFEKHTKNYDSKNNSM